MTKARGRVEICSKTVEEKRIHEAKRGTGIRGGHTGMGVSRPMMAPAITLDEGGMFDSKIAVYSTRSFRKAG